MAHEIYLTNYTARIEGSVQILELGTQGSYGVETLHLNLGDGWSGQGYAITATFHAGDTDTTVMADDSQNVEVPQEATARNKTKRRSVTFAGIADGEELVSCDLAYNVVPTGVTDGDNTEPTASLSEQLYTYYKSAVDAAEASAANAAESVEEIAKAEMTAAADAASAAASAADSATAAANAEESAASAAESAESAAADAATSTAGITSAQEAATASAESASAAEAAAAAAEAAAEAAAKSAEEAAAALRGSDYVIYAVPSQGGTLTYNGAEQAPTWYNYDAAALTIGGVTSATDAGEYTATFTPAEGYTWGDLTDATVEVTWTIGRAAIAAVPTQSGTLTYTGDTLEPVWSGYDSTQMTASGTLSAVNAGIYTATFTPNSNYQWSDGTTSTKSVTWTIAKASLTVPSQSGTLTYTGSALSPTWSNYNTARMTVGGTTSATNAGTYTATFALASSGNYQWPDGSTEAVDVTWTIDKAAGSATLSSDAVSVAIDKTVSITVTRAGDGEVSAVSSNTGAAAVTVSGAVVTVTGIAEGEATITISVAEGTNHYAAESMTAAVTVTAQPSVHIYGASWDGTSTTLWTRTDDAADFTDPVPYVAGATEYGSPFDDLYPWSGMTVSERTGGTMVAIPKFWYSLTKNEDNDGLTIRIADEEVDGYYVSPAHMDRGDGYGERDVVYIGRYHCASDYTSKTGEAPLASITRATARTNIAALGDDIWQCDFATRFTIWLLYIVEFADWESQGCIGYGCGNGSEKEAQGASDEMPYHTGTMQSSRETYGVGVQYRNIEGLWDNVYDWLDGCYNSSAGLNIILNPNDFSDSANGTSIGTPTSGYPSAFGVSELAGFAMFYPTASSGSSTTYSCDYWSFYSAYPCVCAGGNYNQSRNRGLFCLYYYGTTSTYASIGCRLLETPSGGA